MFTKLRYYTWRLELISNYNRGGENQIRFGLSLERRPQLKKSVTNLTQSPGQPSIDGPGSFDVDQNSPSVDLFAVGVFISS